MILIRSSFLSHSDSCSETRPVILTHLDDFVLILIFKNKLRRDASVPSWCINVYGCTVKEAMQYVAE